MIGQLRKFKDWRSVIFTILPKYLLYKIRFLGRPITVDPSSFIAWKSTVRIFPRGYDNSIRIGAYCWIENDAKLVTFKGNIVIGNNTSVNDFTIIRGGGNVTIGNNVRIGPHCTIAGILHRFDRIDIPICDQGTILHEIVIEDDVWLGANCSIVGEVTIGRGSVIGAGSVVTKSIPEYSIAVGNPARVIKSRKD
jgi:acetyltransferase-like isoleucine patch superfamily enzyme